MSEAHRQRPSEVKLLKIFEADDEGLDWKLVGKGGATFIEGKMKGAAACLLMERPRNSAVWTAFG